MSCRAGGGGGLRHVAAQDWRQVGPAAEDPEPPHKALLPDNVSPPRTRCRGQQGKTLALWIWNKRLHWHWEIKKALCVAFCCLWPLKNGCRNMIALKNVTAVLAYECQVEKNIAMGRLGARRNLSFSLV